MGGIVWVDMGPPEKLGPVDNAIITIRRLLFDDSKTIRRTAETLLAKEGCEVFTAVDGFDAVAKIAGKPLFRLLAERHNTVADPNIFVYAAGGYYYPGKDDSALRAEMRSYLDRGYTVVKMKIGGETIAEDRRRIEAALDKPMRGARR